MTKAVAAKSFNVYRQSNGVLSSRPQPAYYETSFLANENPISEGGIWQNGAVGGTMPFDNVMTSGGKALAANYVVDDEYTDASAILDPAIYPFGPDHWVEITIFREPGYTNTNSHEVIIALRGTVNVDGPFYYPHYHLLFTMGGGFQLFWLNGVYETFSELTSQAHNGGINNLVTGDVIRGEIQGTQIRVYLYDALNQVFVLKYSATDSHIATGSPGMMFFVRAGAGQDKAKFCITHWRGGPL